MQGLSELAAKLEKRYPCTDEYDPEELAAWHIRRGGKNSIIIDGRRCSWIGNRGSLRDASLGMKMHFVRCAEVHGEDAAKIWAWLQGYIVGQRTDYVFMFKQEIKDAADEPIHNANTAPPEDVAGDRPDQPSGEDVDASVEPLPF